ncbi:MAG: hypothetical protein N2517_08935, partial [Ignavibacteria bacterium]|nr:hypothetical protein [Ignavibacteria bacterium]
GKYWSISRQKCLTIDTNFFSYELDKPTNQYVVDYVEYVKKIHYNIINSIFFDEDDVNISDRYMVLRKEEVNKFSENNFDEEALDVDLYGESENVQNVTRLAYYNVLNILGYRLSSNPSYKLHLIGYYPYESKNNADSLIPSTRIKAIKNYLEKIWNVSNQITYEIRKELNIEGETQLNSSYKERKSLRDRVDFEIINAKNDVYFVTKTLSISQTKDDLIITWNKNNELAPRKFNLFIYARDELVYEANQNNFFGDKIKIRLGDLGLVYNRFLDSLTVVINPDTLDNMRSKQIIKLKIPVKYNTSEMRRKHNSAYDTTKYQIFFTNYLYPEFVGIIDISKFGRATDLINSISFNPMYHHLNFSIKLPSALSQLGTKSKMAVVLTKALIRYFIQNLKMNESERFFSINHEKSLSTLYKKVELPEFRIFDSRADITIFMK